MVTEALAPAQHSTALLSAIRCLSGVGPSSFVN
jgi:hypothetical protein